MRGQFFSTLCGGLVGGCIVLAMQGNLVKAENVRVPGIVEVKELNVVDSKGKVRLNLRCDTNDEPRMRMLDADGTMRCVMGLGNKTRQENPFLYLIDQSGVKANLSIAEDGAPVFFLNGRDGKPRLFMCASPADNGEISQLVVYGNSKDERTEIISDQGQTGVSSYKHGVMRTYSGIMPEGLAGLMVNGGDGKPGTIIGVTADDRRLMAKLKKGQTMNFQPERTTKKHKTSLQKAIQAPTAPTAPVAGPGAAAGEK